MKENIHEREQRGTRKKNFEMRKKTYMQSSAPQSYFNLNTLIARNLFTKVHCQIEELSAKEQGMGNNNTFKKKKTGNRTCSSENPWRSKFRCPATADARSFRSWPMSCSTPKKPKNMEKKKIRNPKHAHIKEREE